MGTYWLMVHPVNKFWVAGIGMTGASSSFFSTLSGSSEPKHWTELRSIWEWSHVARAALSSVSLISLTYVATRFQETSPTTIG